MGFVYKRLKGVLGCLKNGNNLEFRMGDELIVGFQQQVGLERKGFCFVENGELLKDKVFSSGGEFWFKIGRFLSKYIQVS